MKNNNIPKLRYPEFTDAWEKCKLGEVKDVRDGTHSSPKFYTDGYALITSKNLTEFGLDLSSVSFISQQDFDEINKRSKVDIGDIIFGMIGTIGNPILLEKEGFAIKNVALIKQKEGEAVDNLFLIQLLKSSIFNNYIAKENTGGTQKFLGLAQVRSFSFFNPTLPEQQKIGTLFRRLDRLITLHKRKWDDVILLKKALLQKMFPKNGSNFPALRFPEFTDAWEKCKLGEVKDVRDGTHSSPKFYTDGYALITSKNLTEFGLDLSSVSFISQQDFDEINKRSKVDIGDIIFGMIGTIGNPILLEKEGFAIKNVALIKQKEGEAVDNLFLIQLLKSSIFNNYIAKENTGGTQKFLGLAQVRSFSFFNPTLPEQQKIGTLFRRLDRLITLHKRQHEHYQLLKKALLQQMFV
ncbi:restriction endonuclease subunit S [Avibacterium paragallinarum]|uniref:restriction endonuclease subunit S n=1 Tax=Avibacterium paragallinarum TaxID=728 RepID=UPI003986D06C